MIMMIKMADKEILKFLIIPAVLGIVMLPGCAAPPAPSTTTSSQDGQRIADLQVVDCLLPGQVRRLGASTYLTPRRPVRTTAADCRIRGGEYVEFDRADYRTALNVWMPTAEAGDAEAQVNVGEIFERGLGSEPNYEAAAIWYQRAAEQGNARAQFNLGTLYEQGLGVEQDRMQALNLYRQAWGMPEDDVIFQSAAFREQQTLREELQQELASRETQISVLRRQTAQLQTDLENQQNSAQAQQASQNQLREELLEMENLITQLEEERLATQVAFTELPVFREPVAEEAEQEGAPARQSQLPAGMFGNYYALVIGNQDYARIEDLQSPRNDALKVSELLKNKYGFTVRTLIDASNVEVMQAINDLNEVLGADDNLLIFYAGHGTRLRTGEIEDGYWLPVNADPPPTDTFWISNEFITRHLARMNAKRVLVVADSCYAGLLSNAPGFIMGGTSRTAYDEDYLRYKLPKRARLLLSSGGDSPVLDNLGQGNSIFARAFLDVLESNDQIMAGPDLFLKVRDIVSEAASTVEFEQEPEFKAIKGAGHEVGDFFFVPLASLQH